MKGMKLLVTILLATLCFGCSRDTEDNDTNIRVIHMGPGDPPPVQSGCWFDYQLNCHGCWYIFANGEECFLCDGPPIGPGPIYPPYGQ